MIAKWNECNDVYELGQILVKCGAFNTPLWRQFHCRCYRNVWNYITEKSKTAIVHAERVVFNDMPVSELASVHQEMIEESDVAWSRVNKLKLPSDDDDFVWPISAEVDDAWCVYLSAECAKVATQTEIDAYVIPESASSLLAWATARKDVLSNQQQESRELVEFRWKEIRDAEEREQASILRGLWSPTTK